MKLEAGKYYRTRDDRKAKVLCVDAPDDKYSCVGYTYLDSGICSGEWRNDGSYHEDDGECRDDLVAEWHEPVTVSGWVLVDSGGFQLKGLMDDDAATRIRQRGPVKGQILIYVSGTEGVEP